MWKLQNVLGGEDIFGRLLVGLHFLLRDGICTQPWIHRIIGWASRNLGWFISDLRWPQTLPQQVDDSDGNPPRNGLPRCVEQNESAAVPAASAWGFFVPFSDDFRMIFGWSWRRLFCNPQGTTDRFSMIILSESAQGWYNSICTHKTHRDRILYKPILLPVPNKDHDTTLSSSSSHESYQEMFNFPFAWRIFSAGTIILQKLIWYICHNIYLYTMCYFVSTAACRISEAWNSFKKTSYNRKVTFTLFFSTCWYPSKKKQHTSGLLLTGRRSLDATQCIGPGALQ